MTNYKRGDIVLVLFPNSDLQTFKKRPALIVQADDLQTNLPQVIVALITSNMTRANHKSRAIVLLTHLTRRDEPGSFLAELKKLIVKH